MVVVLLNGSALAVNWPSNMQMQFLKHGIREKPAAKAIGHTLIGKSNPSGRFRLRSTLLSTTFRLHRLLDAEPHLSLFQGNVLYRFGYGLSYTKIQLLESEAFPPAMCRQATR